MVRNLLYEMAFWTTEHAIATGLSSAVVVALITTWIAIAPKLEEAWRPPNKVHVEWLLIQRINETLNFEGVEQTWPSRATEALVNVPEIPEKFIQKAELGSEHVRVRIRISFLGRWADAKHGVWVRREDGWEETFIDNVVHSIKDKAVYSIEVRLEDVESWRGEENRILIRLGGQAQ